MPAGLVFSVSALILSIVRVWLPFSEVEERAEHGRRMRKMNLSSGERRGPNT